MINPMAAIIKFINGRNDSHDYLSGAIDYITDATKTDCGTLVATQGCSRSNALEDILVNKVLHHKSHGKQGVHFVLAFPSAGNAKSPADVLNVTREIVSAVYPDYLAVMAVHTDSKALHSHVILDAVNAVSGKKFSQGPGDLNRVKQRANNILQAHGFEIIRASANDFIDHTDYSQVEGFDFLEPNLSEILQESELSFNILPNTRLYDDEIGGTLTSELATVFHRDAMSFLRKFNRRGADMEQRNDLMPVQSADSMPPTLLNDTAVPTAVCAPNNYPTTTVATGPTFRIKGTPQSDFAGLGELVKQTTAFAQDHHREAANLALAMQVKAQEYGHPTNVTIVAGPIFDIDLCNEAGPQQVLYGDDDEEYY